MREYLNRKFIPHIHVPSIYMLSLGVDQHIELKYKKKQNKTEICDISVRHVYRNVL